MSPTPRTAALLLIGDELLSGKVHDANGPLVVESFRSAGVDLREVRVIPDTIAGIAEAVRALRTHHDIVVTSGGVGPTHDDLTMRGVAAAFDVPIVTHDELATAIRRFYHEQPDQLRVWLRMAQLPQGCELLFDGDIVWPVYRMEQVYILPGIPQIFRRQFLAILHRFAAARIRQRTLYLTLGEGDLAEPLEDVGGRFPDVSIGSYPLLEGGLVRTRVTLESRDEQQLDASCEALRQTLPEACVLRIARDEPLLQERGGHD